MRWRGRRQSGNVVDRRGAGGGMGSGRIPVGLRVGGARGGLGIGGILVLVVLGLVFGIDPRMLLGVLDDGGQGGFEEETGTGVRQTGRPDDELAAFVSVVLADTEEVWNRQFAGLQAGYREPTLVLFTDAVRSGCGHAGSSVGPFYCPADERLYIDLGFYRDLRSRLGAPGDFAQAYVVAHEVGHHVQNLLGISGAVQAERARLPQAEANALSVRLELQADCLAGIWAHFAETELGVLEAGDIEEALNAAAAIGDDRLQRRAGGQVVEESFTHGSSEQRVSWFSRGYETGGLEACDTFRTASRQPR
jgi:predicted metalloprotease